jgi:AraC-like DNA-binding protein
MSTLPTRNRVSRAVHDLTRRTYLAWADHGRLPRTHSIAEIAAEAKLSTSTVYRHRDVVEVHERTLQRDLMHSTPDQVRRYFGVA